MPLTARIKETSEAIFIDDFANPKIELMNMNLISPYPDCDVPVSVVEGTKVRNHFRHKKGYIVSTEYESMGGKITGSGESIEHLELKRAVAKKLKESGKYEKVIVEYPITDRKRIADIMTIDKNGFYKAFEIQLSIISPDLIRDRITDYFDDEIESVWLFDENDKNHYTMKHAAEMIGAWTGLINYQTITNYFEIEKF